MPALPRQKHDIDATADATSSAIIPGLMSLSGGIKNNGHGWHVTTYRASEGVDGQAIILPVAVAVSEVVSVLL
jgi:hypothetical protein